MIQHVWSLICRQSIVDPESNNLTIVETLETINIDIKSQKGSPVTSLSKGSVNAFPTNFELTSLFYRPDKGKEEAADVEVVVMDPKDKEIGRFKNTIQFQAEHDRIRIRTKFNSLGVTVGGEYMYEVYLQEPEGKSRHVGTVPLSIKLMVDEEEVN